MLKKTSFIIILLSLFPFSIYAQLNLVRNDNPIVRDINGNVLENPWAGGFNSVQFSEIDLNLDGIKDLFVFDRSGNRISTFINAGTPNTASYRHAPQYIENFPQGLHDWVLLRDYNCDDKMDIFTYSSGSVRVYKNTSTSSILGFTLVADPIISNYLPNLIPLFISSVDIPAIDDIDGDGDLDILTFSILGSNVEYHKNLSIENYGSCDSLSFELSNRCWGFFKENFTSNSVTIFDTCGFNVPNPQKLQGGNKHSGSTLFTLNVDDNKSKDLVLGDVSFNNFTLLINNDNTTDLSSSSIIAQDTVFPQNHSSSIATEINVFPAGFYLDVNNDNVKDLIAAPNCFSGCKNSTNVWFYENNNIDNLPDFNLVTEGFLQEGMIEVGDQAFPVFFDHNSDGLMDIVIGNHSEFDLSTPDGNRSFLSLYENVGTATIPAYQLITADYVNISNINLDLIANKPTKRIIPTFGDLDNDGDEDMLIGDLNGKIHLFTNSAGPGNTAIFNLTDPEYFAIDVGNFAAPQLIDLNRDALLDIVIGKENGFFSYYENQGTATSPLFSLTTDSLGFVNTKDPLNFSGNSAPYIYDAGGIYKMISGSISGYIYEFGNIDGNLTGTFDVIDSSFLDIKDGSRSFISLADATNDGKLDMLLGNHAGGVAFYQSDFIASVKEDVLNLENLAIYPNPAKNTVRIDIGENSLDKAQVEILNLLGKTVLSQKITQQKSNVSLNQLSAGIYLIKFSNTSGSSTIKLVKQ